MTLLIFYVLLALGVSFLCSIMEAVLLSVTPSYVAMLERRGVPVASHLRRLKEDIDRPLAAILSLNTIAHTVGAAGAGAQAALVWESVPLGIFSAVLTLLILVLSEIIPKTLGALYWRALAPVLVRVLVPTIWLMWPLVKLSQGITRLLSHGERHPGISREEITALAELGTERGVFEEEESRILKNLFRFRSLRARDVMTPRIVLFALPEARSIAEVLNEHPTLRFSRLPVYRSNKDDITGYVLKDDLLLKAAQGQEHLPLREIKREIQIVPDSMQLPHLFKRLLEETEHIALVVDEYGGTEGIVTMEDIVETLLGLEIVDEVDSVEDMQALARRQWIRRAQRLGLVPRDFEVPAEGDQNPHRLTGTPQSRTEQENS
ncbi:MAG: hypothetical protein KatS3mg043_0744 [Rhodothermaceae bacterium]|nr:MAG: hypothetical protein KatS3mg043_0744 [Rhodothermaceae bacterium]